MSPFPPPTVKQPICGASRYLRTSASVGGWPRSKRARRLALSTTRALLPAASVSVALHQKSCFSEERPNISSVAKTSCSKVWKEGAVGEGGATCNSAMVAWLARARGTAGSAPFSCTSRHRETWERSDWHLTVSLINPNQSFRRLWRPKLREIATKLRS
eukprot:3570875-Prymnesium_polylepis.1